MLGSPSQTSDYQMIADLDFKPKSDFAQKLGQGSYSFSNTNAAQSTKNNIVEPVNETKMSDNEAF
jgi:hypothetical protein